MHNNIKRKYNYIIDIYKEYKQEDIPDTFIVFNVFPKHGVFISYRQWVRIKGMKPSQYQTNQLSLF